MTRREGLQRTWRTGELGGTYVTEKEATSSQHLLVELAEILCTTNEAIWKATSEKDVCSIFQAVECRQSTRTFSGANLPDRMGTRARRPAGSIHFLA